MAIVCLLAVVPARRGK